MRMSDNQNSELGTRNSELPLRVIPLGGVGTFGMNCTVLEHGDHMIVVDAGLKIPQGNYPGVDLILPDFTYVLDNTDRLKGIVLTHGHDDHIGSLPYLLRHVNVPVYGTALTLALVRERLANSNGNNGPADVDLRQMLFYDPIKIGPFTIEPVRVNHSIPDGAALIVDTPVGKIVHTGDFKMDNEPVDGHITDLARLAQAGQSGVLLLMADSTNADRPGVTPPEKEVGHALEDLMRQATGRVYIATFASHIHRIQLILEAARRSSRMVVMEGRRIVRNCHIAKKLGYLNPPPGILIPLEEAADKPDANLVCLVTGSQGEPMSALSRIVRGEHAGLKVGEGDTVVFSSRIIPGNELTTGRIIDDLFRMGAQVFYQDTPMVHVSGHGAAQEIEQVIAAVAPRFFVPVHGDYRQLVACTKLAQETGVASTNTFILEPGNVLELKEDRAALGEPVTAGRLLMDGEFVTDLSGPLVKERRRLAREGLITVVASIPSEGEKPAIEAAVHSIGVSLDDPLASLNKKAARLVSNMIGGWRGVHFSHDDLKEEIRVQVRAIYRKALQKKPTVVVILVEE
jgi:ribonuclease J